MRGSPAASPRSAPATPPRLSRRRAMPASPNSPSRGWVATRTYYVAVEGDDDDDEPLVVLGANTPLWASLSSGVPNYSSELPSPRAPATPRQRLATVAGFVLFQTKLQELWLATSPSVSALVLNIWPRALLDLAMHFVWQSMVLLHMAALALVGLLVQLCFSEKALRPPGERGRALFPKGRALTRCGTGVVAAPPDLEASAVELSRRLKAGGVSSVGLVRSSIQRIQQVNMVLNAVVVDRFEAALFEASQADERLARARAEGTLDALPPLLGVPFSTKESFEVAGLPNTSGLLSRIKQRGLRDASAVKRLRAAGAILICTSNTSELCMWYESYNYVYGLTRNPYHLAHTVGGSSGGEGAVISSCCSAFGLGSDVGGSLRLPAAFCGIYAHKPTGGLVTNDGQYPMAGGSVANVLATGPMCRHAEDLLVLLNILAKPAGASPAKMYTGAASWAGSEVGEGEKQEWRQAGEGAEVPFCRAAGGSSSGFDGADKSSHGSQAGRRRGRDREAVRSQGRASGGDEDEGDQRLGKSASTAQTWGARARSAWNSLSPTRRLFGAPREGKGASTARCGEAGEGGRQRPERGKTEKAVRGVRPGWDLEQKSFKGDMRGLRVVCVGESAQMLTHGVSEEVAAKLAAVAAFLKSRGAEVEVAPALPFTATSLELWSGRMLWAQHEHERPPAEPSPTKRGSDPVHL